MHFTPCVDSLVPEYVNERKDDHKCDDDKNHHALKSNNMLKGLPKMGILVQLI